MEKFLAGRHFRIKCIFVYWSHQNLFCLSVLDKLNLRLTSGSKCYQTNKLFFCSSIAEVCVLRVSAILWAAYIRVINDKSLLQSWTAVYSETISSLWAYSQRWNVDQTFKKKKSESVKFIQKGRCFSLFPQHVSICFERFPPPCWCSPSKIAGMPAP